MDIDFKRIEEKWQKRWEESGVFRAKDEDEKPKYYVLEMFPYPSASGLHMGHAWNYTIGDIFARFKKMQGYNVLHPMGYDSFGLPAENAAIKEGVHPEDYTEKAIKNYIMQSKKLGISYDWSRLLKSSDPKYYKWDQWIFLQFLKKGLAYKKEAQVNWCPECKTVLANEQVVNGKCWRHEKTSVKIKSLNQWYLKITKYAKELLEGLDGLNWPKKTIAMQKNWIGESHGVEILFEVNGENWPVFTTRPDTIFGVTFMVVSSYHPRLSELVTEEQKEKVEEYLKNQRTVSIKDIESLEKEGVFTGSYATNPINREKIPIYAGNFVVADYGSGMVMAVPAHDARDYEFAKKYNIPVKKVIEGKLEKNIIKEGKLINSGKFSGLDSNEAKEKISKFLESIGKAKRKIQYKLRDWLISRQRYWGTPIPIVYCQKCGTVPVPEEELPVRLPREVKFGKGNPLETAEEWIKTTCPKCKVNARRETDTMDTFVNSSWYFFRYADPNNEEKIFNRKKADKWMPIDLYVGGYEHATTHLLYFRFYTKFFRDIGLTSISEPAKRLFHQGMLLGSDGQRMSKSRGNVILPETVSEKYGIDSARLFFCDLASPDKDISWSDKGILGSIRFIKMLSKIIEKEECSREEEKIELELNNLISEVTKNIEALEYRKAVIKIRSFAVKIQKKEKIKKSTKENLLKILSPFIPHIAEELWEKLGNKSFISTESWPEVKEIKKGGEKEENLTEGLVKRINKLLEKFPKTKKIAIYVVPKDMEKIDKDRLKKEFSQEVLIFLSSEKNKYDPQNKSKKAKLGMPSIYLE